MEMVITPVTCKLPSVGYQYEEKNGSKIPTGYGTIALHNGYLSQRRKWNLGCRLFTNVDGKINVTEGRFQLKIGETKGSKPVQFVHF
jgi:hypothetical protein